MCVHANLFGATEYPDNPAKDTSSVTPITAQVDVVTSRAVLVNTDVQNSSLPAEYGLLQNL